MSAKVAPEVFEFLEAKAEMLKLITGANWAPFLVPTPAQPHTHTYCFPVFEEAKPDVRVVCVGFRCECGGIELAA